MYRKRKNFTEFKYPNRIRELRGDLTQKDFLDKLADKISISDKTLSDLENGKIRLSSAIALEIAELFNVSLDWLYGRDVKRDVASGSSFIDKIKRLFQIMPHKVLGEGGELIDAFRILVNRDYLKYLGVISTFESEIGDNSSNQMWEKLSELITQEETSQELDEFYDFFKNKYYKKIFGNELNPEEKQMVIFVALPVFEEYEEPLDETFALARLKNAIRL